MSATNAALPTKLPQSTILKDAGGDSQNGNARGVSAQSRRRSLLPQRNLSGGRPRPATVLASDTLRLEAIAWDTASGAEVEDEGIARARQPGKELQESGVEEAVYQGSGDHESAVAEQRRLALDALMGDGPQPPTNEYGHAQKTSRQSRAIPKPTAQKSSMPAPSGLGRATSIRKAGSASTPVSRPERVSRMLPPSAAASAVSRSHTRQASSVSGGGVARPSSRSSTTTNTSGRPPSASSVTSRTSRADTAARPDSALQRNGSTKDVRKEHTRTASALPSLHAKPQFSTYQQHYSPKKNFAPKPLTSTYLPAAPAPARTVVTTTETQGASLVRQQTELLQLHLLRSQALTCLESFEEGAERKLRERFKKLGVQYTAIQEHERRERTSGNVAALEDWGTVSGGTHENLQVLSSVLREMTALQGEVMLTNDDECDDHTSRFGRVVEQFSKWIRMVENTWNSRSNARAGVLDIIEPLDRQWHSEAAALQRRITLLLRELDSLDAPAPDSSISAIISTAKASLRHAFDEIKIIESISARVMQREADFVDEQIRAVDLDSASWQ